MSENMKAFDLKVISINGIFYDDKAVEIILPCHDGEMGILYGHEEMIYAIYDGVIKIKKTNGEWVFGVVSIGSVQYTVDNKCIVLVNTAENPVDIDKRRAQEAYDAAMDHLNEKQSIKEFKKTQAGLSRAMARLSAASKYKD